MRLAKSDELFFKIVFGCFCFPFVVLWKLTKLIMLCVAAVAHLGGGITEEELNEIQDRLGFWRDKGPIPKPTLNVKDLDCSNTGMMKI